MTSHSAPAAKSRVLPFVKPRTAAVVGGLSAALIAGFAVVSVASATTAETVVASDSMSRTVAGGWSNATVGGSYTLSKAAKFSVNGSYGVLNLDEATASQTATLSAVKVANVTASVGVAVKSLPTTGSGTYNSVVVRAGSNTGYRATLRVAPGGAAFLTISRVDGSASNITYLTKEFALPTKVKAGQFVTVVFAAAGTTAVDLKVKAFTVGSAEPQWQLTHTDSSTKAIKVAGTVQLTSYSSRLSGAAQVWYDNLKVTVPAAAAPVTTPTTTTTTPTANPTVTAPAVTPAVDAPASTTPTTTTPTTPAPVVTPAADTPAVAPRGVGGTGSVPVGAANYAVPANAVFVSPAGSDSGNGSSSSPFKTVAAAVAKAPAGATIVLRGGDYHESVKVPSTKPLTIQNYPGEAVWFDGSTRVSAFQQTGSTWTLTNWTNEYDASPTFTFGAPANTAPSWGFVNAAYPMAAHPDQVWIDGVSQQQVSSADKVAAGTFYVDNAANKLILGSNPAGRDVRASDLITAIDIKSSNSTLRGVGVRRYSTSLPHMGAVISDGDNNKLENLTINDNSTSGLFVKDANVTLKNITTLRNGLLGIHANNSDKLSLENVLSSYNNAERFNASPVSGGFKVSRARDITVKNSSFDNNYGVGLWADESVYDTKIANNTMVNNSKHGISIEISAKTTIANNYIAKSGSYGIKINDVNGARIYNNVIADNTGRGVYVVQDNRKASDRSVPGHDARQAFPDPTMTWLISDIYVENNIFSGGKGDCQLCINDTTGRTTAAQIVKSANGNVFQRATTTSPARFVLWSTTSFKTAAEFTKGTNYTATELTGTAAITTTGTATTAITNTNATPLPADIAALTGQTTGVKQTGLFK